MRPGNGLDDCSEYIECSVLYNIIVSTNYLGINANQLDDNTGLDYFLISNFFRIGNSWYRKWHLGRSLHESKSGFGEAEQQ